MDYESIKRLELDHMNIDTEKSFEIYDPTTNHHIITIYFKEQKIIYCPKCGCLEITKRGSRKQIIKYSTTLEQNIIIHLYRKVFKCNSCDSYFKEENNFILSKRNISLQKDLKILQKLKSITSTFTGVAKEFDVSPTYVLDLFDKKIDLKRSTLTQVLCADEVYSKKLSKHSYCFVLFSPQQRKILDVLDSRRKLDLFDYFGRIPFEERKKVEYFSIDLYDHYRQVGKICLPNALICADSFHVIKNLNNDFNKIRIKIMKKYTHLKYENSNYYWLYKKYWKFLLMDTSKLHYNTIKVNKSGMYLTLRKIIELMLGLDDELKLAYNLKESYRLFNSTATIDNALEWLDELIIDFKNSKIDEYVHFWKLLKNWKQEIINSFYKVNGHRISNGPMERINRDIKTIFRISFGSRNFTRTRNKIMYIINDDAYILNNRKKHTNKQKYKPRGSYKKQ